MRLFRRGRAEPVRRGRAEPVRRGRAEPVPRGRAEPAPAADPDLAVRVQDLRRTFGSFAAVDGISVAVRRGEVFGFLGPNGSGKTTTIRMLTGALAPSSGEIEVLGTDVARHPEAIHHRIGYMSQRFSPFEDLTVEENMRFYAGVHGISRETYARRREYVLEMADLRGRERELTADLSVGWRQRLALGTATIHEPELLFLDEPTSGVDPVARRQFWDLLHDLAGRGVTLFVTTHYMDEAANCTRLAFMYRGRIVADGTPRDLVTGGTPVLEVHGPEPDAVHAWLEAASDVRDVHLSEGALRVTAPGTDPDDLTRRLAAAGFPDVTVRSVEPSVEDVFVGLVTAR
ncbi:ABC transporter ATP-binding protein [Raineyella sp. LH-20]|uniref:ABC transporter ATP-binding protein n=1 Tax=Raineyella sp. LH-20 TaxID=3081204 RepID=UPI002953FB2C|nr:ABC transporter ATP-binding protein [Raineyella sp. LH-20]WOP18174.1 ABC transporter ATP-binding protein [Raineyella sp. LH-20]